MVEKDYMTRTGSFITPYVQIGLDTMTISLRNYGFATVVIDSVLIYDRWKPQDSLQYFKLLYLLSSARGFYNFHVSLKDSVSQHISTDTLVAIPLFLKADSSLPLLKINRRALPELFDSAVVVIRYRSAVGPDSIIEKSIPFRDFIPIKNVQFIMLNEAARLRPTTSLTSNVTLEAIPPKNTTK